MIQRAESLDRRMIRETLRHAGSLATLCYYKGDLPTSCDGPASGERLVSKHATEEIVRALARGHEPEPLADATCWRLYDNMGAVVMQGDWR
jgi:hypothetical protein